MELNRSLLGVASRISLDLSFFEEVKSIPKDLSGKHNSCWVIDLGIVILFLIGDRGERLQSSPSSCSMIAIVGLAVIALGLRILWMVVTCDLSSSSSKLKVNVEPMLGSDLTATSPPKMFTILLQM